jgi:hypothetical protein
MPSTRSHYSNINSASEERSEPTGRAQRSSPVQRRELSDRSGLLESGALGRPGVSEELVDQALEGARLRRAVGELGDGDRERLVDGLFEQLSAERDQLPEELRERLLDGMIDELIAGKRGEREILGHDGVLGELTRRLVERALREELSEHLRRLCRSGAVLVPLSCHGEGVAQGAFGQLNGHGT